MLPFLHRLMRSHAVAMLNLSKTDGPKGLNLPDYKVAPTRVHAIDWDGSGTYNIVFGEQVIFDGHLCKKTTSHRLKIFVFSVEGELLAEIQYTDTRREGFFYNGEVRSRVLDIDGDGKTELIFPRQDGNVMIIGKK